MVMWSYLTPANLLDFQRACAVRSMMEECRRLLRDGYPVDADRVLDELMERQRSWEPSR